METRVDIRQNMHTHYFPHNSPLLVFQESTLDPNRIRRCLLSKMIMQSRSSQGLRVFLLEITRYIVPYRELQCQGPGAPRLNADRPLDPQQSLLQ